MPREIVTQRQIPVEVKTVKDSRYECSLCGHLFWFGPTSKTEAEKCEVECQAMLDAYTTGCIYCGSKNIQKKIRRFKDTEYWLIPADEKVLAVKCMDCEQEYAVCSSDLLKDMLR